jgi:hypothetical protein
MRSNLKTCLRLYFSLCREDERPETDRLPHRHDRPAVLLQMFNDLESGLHLRGPCPMQDFYINVRPQTTGHPRYL